MIVVDTEENNLLKKTQYTELLLNIQLVCTDRLLCFKNDYYNLVYIVPINVR